MTNETRAPSAARGTPLWRSPWVIGWVIGVAVLTGIRPFLRRIPDPPPVLAQATGLTFEVEGAAWALEQAPTPATLLVWAGARPSESEAALQLLRKLSLVFASEGYAEVTYVVVGPSSGDASKWGASVRAGFGLAAGDRWIFAAGAGSDALRVLLDPLSTGLGAGGGVVLLDGSGQVRGFYGALSDETLSEVVHRTRHVVRPPEEDA